MIKPQRIVLPISRTNFHGPKDVQAIEVQLLVLVRVAAVSYLHVLHFSEVHEDNWRPPL